MTLKTCAVLLLAILDSACSINVKPKQYVGLPGKPHVCLNYAIPVEIGVPENSLLGDPFIDSVTNASRSATAAAAAQPVSNSMLFLSGGSQHGAFGAGFLSRWSAMRGGLPRFRVVTGISTGALQSTLAFTNETREIVNRYAVRSESELLRANTNAHIDGGTVESVRAATTIVKRGALAELIPARRQLLGAGPEDLGAVLNSRRLGRVAEEAASGRKLFIGTVELDTGKAVAFDLTRIAVDYVAEPDGARKEILRQCYAEVLIASSSVPIAAQPSFIEGRMFIDGGARFGVLPAKLLELGRRLAQSDRRRASAKPNLFVIVNGTLQTSSLCDLGDCPAERSTPPLPTRGQLSSAHGTWTFPSLAFRSLSILINQSYVASVEIARRDAEWCRRAPSDVTGAGGCAAGTAAEAMNVHFVRILPEDMSNEKMLFGVNGLRQPVESDNPFEADKQNCETWSDRDEAQERPRPHEFHPRYMRCLIQYGGEIAANLRWDQAEPR